MDQANTGLSQEYLSKGLDNKVVKGYYKLLVDLAEYFGADRSQAKKELLDVVNFEIDLAMVCFMKHCLSIWKKITTICLKITINHAIGFFVVHYIV